MKGGGGVGSETTAPRKKRLGKGGEEHKGGTPAKGRKVGSAPKRKSGPVFLGREGKKGKGKGKGKKGKRGN